MLFLHTETVHHAESIDEMIANAAESLTNLPGAFDNINLITADDADADETEDEDDADDEDEDEADDADDEEDDADDDHDDEDEDKVQETDQAAEAV